MGRRFDRDELLDRVDLRALLDEISGPATHLGRSARWHCPVAEHNDIHPSVTVFTDHRGVERWRCWSGGHGGTAIDAICASQRLGMRDAVEELARRAGMQPDDTMPSRRFARRPRPDRAPVALAPEVVHYVEACAGLLWKPEGREVLAYLVDERGLDPKVLRANRVGADPGPRWLRRAGGLPRSGPGAVFPVLYHDGNIAYCQTRYLDVPDNRSKYDNPASRLGDNPRVGWTRPPGQARDPLLLCEGLPDAYTANGAGYEAVALLGVGNATPALCSRLAGLVGSRPVIVAMDGDAPGRAAAKTLCSSLEARGTMVVELPLPSGADLNGWVRSAHSAPELGPPTRPMPNRPEAPAPVPTIAGP